MAKKYNYKKLHEKYGNSRLRTAAVRSGYKNFYNEYLEDCKQHDASKVCAIVFMTLMLVASILSFFVFTFILVSYLFMVFGLFEVHEMRIYTLRKYQLIDTILSASFRHTLFECLSNVEKKGKKNGKSNN